MKGVHKHLVILFMTFFAVFILVPASGQQGYSIISGRVIDVQSGEPIQNATIMILGYYRDPRYYGDAPRRTYVKSTDSLGFFSVNVEPTAGYAGFWYNVYALCDREETIGVDYVPAKWSTYLEVGSQASFIFLLEPGASLFLEGEIRFVESPNPSYSHKFMVLSPSGKPVVSSYSISQYGMVSDITNLHLNQSLAIVPAEKEVIVKVGASVSSPSIYREFIVDGKVGFFKLAQGASLHVDIREYCFKFNVAKVRENIDSAVSLLQDAEDAGFLVQAERQDLLEALSLVDRSMVSMKRGSYYESFATLRSAYLLTTETTSRLQGLFGVSSQSAPILTFFFVFIAIAATSLVLEGGAGLEVTVKEKHFITIPIRPLIMTAVYASLLGLFFILFPGCRLTPLTTFIGIGVFSLLVGQVALMGLPHLLAEKKTEGRYIAFRSAVIAVFSIACRNLRRRKMRTTLSIITVMILVFGFITLTSIAPSYGLVSRSLGPSKVSADALLIRAHVENPTEVLFNPLPSDFLPWLERQPNVTLVAPKAENFPREMPLGNLYTSSNALMFVQGVLGIVPSIESKLTRINSTVIEGEYLQDNDYDGVLISLSLAARLGVKVGEPLYGFGKRFFVKGLFDSDQMEKLLDLNGNLMIPIRSYGPAGYGPCLGDEIIVTTFETALTLPSVAISRVIVQLNDPKDLLDFARTIALVYEYETWVSFDGTLYARYVGSYLEEKGLESIPFLMSLVLLNISLTMLGSVNERRPEIATMSSIGLNPTHIILLFMTEAAVLGFVGGGLGYLLGISGYRMATIPFLGGLQVREKVSAEWGILALLLSITATVLASAIPAIKASTIVTPSLLRKWRLEETGSPKEAGRPWTIDLPVRLRPREVDTFVSFIQKRLQSVTAGPLEYIEKLKREDADTGEEPLKRLSFKHFYSEGKSLGTTNELIVSRSVGKDYFDAKLVSLPLRGIRESVHKVVTYVRRLIFEWNTMTFKVATPVDQSLSQLYTLINVYNPTSLFIASAEFDIHKRLNILVERLDWEGIRVPEMVIYQMSPLDIEECRKKTEEMVSRANLVCLSGGPSSICAALAVNAAKQDKMMCHIVDSRSQEEQRANPFHVLKVVNISTETISQSQS